MNSEFIFILYYSYNGNTLSLLSTVQEERKIKPLAQRDFEINGNKVWICLCVCVCIIFKYY